MARGSTGLGSMHPTAKPPYTIESPGYEKKPGETLPRRHPDAKDGLGKSPYEDVKTVYDIIKRNARVYPTRRAAGIRKLIKIHKEVKKVPKMVDGQRTEVEKEWLFYELTDYSFMNYTELDRYVTQLAAGLRKLGLNKGSKLHLFAATHLNWMALSHACGSQSMAIVTAYDTLGVSGLEHSLLQGEVEAMYTDPHLLKTAQEPLKKVKNLKFVIYNESSNFSMDWRADVDAFKKANPDVALYSVEELRKLGEDNPVDAVPAQPEDLFCIMYTSGSGGVPKGAYLTHKNVLAAVSGEHTVVRHAVTEADMVLAYLPLAHIFELVVENLFLITGCAVGYGNPKTLSDASVRNCPGDMRALKPTVLVGVPQIWETIKKGVTARVNSTGGLAKSLFWTAYNYKTFMVRNGLPLESLFDGIVFTKVREMTGGRIRFIMNGGSNISEDTRHFLSVTVAPLVNGYGLTETCANGALGDPLNYRRNVIGVPPAGVEIKLVSLPELDYSTDTTPPQGEIWMKGPAIMKEYYKLPEETEKNITPDGWFKTGDIGEFDEWGMLRVIDRVKNLVKMQGGEYIALEKLETAYRPSHYVQTIAIDADTRYSKPIAVIFPNEKVLGEEAKSLGIDEHAMHNNPKIKDLVLKDLIATGKKNGLSPAETIAGVVISNEEWTPQSGLLTATQKLNRRGIKEHFKAQIEEAYKPQM